MNDWTILAQLVNTYNQKTFYQGALLKSHFKSFWESQKKKKLMQKTFIPYSFADNIKD